MATITEDYVSFEIAKLLKEKGFDVPCNCYGAYNGVNLTYRLCITDKCTNWNKHTDKFIISCPTLQMAMKWLRKVHNIFIELKMSKNTFLWGYKVSISKGSIVCLHANIFNKCEEAAETAIRYCLENLI